MYPSRAASKGDGWTYYLVPGPFDIDNDEECSSLLILPGDWRLFEFKLDRQPEPQQIPPALAHEIATLRSSCEAYPPAWSLAFWEMVHRDWEPAPEPYEAIRHWLDRLRFHLEDQQNHRYVLSRCLAHEEDDHDFAVGVYVWLLSQREETVLCLDLYGYPTRRPAANFALSAGALGRGEDHELWW